VNFPSGHSKATVKQFKSKRRGKKEIGEDPSVRGEVPNGFNQRVEKNFLLIKIKKKKKKDRKKRSYRGDLKV